MLRHEWFGSAAGLNPSRKEESDEENAIEEVEGT
jgi:hypothetical protein